MAAERVGLAGDSFSAGLLLMMIDAAASSAFVFEECLGPVGG
jgi:hypothetical protein